MWLKCVAVLIILGVTANESEATKCSYVKKITTIQYNKEKYCGNWQTSETVTKYVTVYECCDGWKGADCNIPICGQLPGLAPCDRQEGNMTTKEKQVFNSSGGTCIRPNECDRCNPGYYGLVPGGGFCRECAPVTNCQLPKCTGPDSSMCETCIAETKRESPQTGLNAYIGHTCSSTDPTECSECREGCSWREGRRCEPGNCGATYFYSDCQCAKGFEDIGRDCRKVSSTNTAVIFSQVLTLAGTGKLKVIVDKAQHQNDTVWTRELSWNNISVDVDTVFEENYAEGVEANEKAYIKERKIGVKHINSRLYYLEGTTGKTSAWSKTLDCKYSGSCFELETIPVKSMSVSTPTSGSPVPLHFKHNTKLQFEVEVTNGGRITYYNYYDRVSGSYELEGVSVTNTLMLGFDTIEPKHCVQSLGGCSQSPLIAPDFLNKTTFDVSWSGWIDEVSGISKYELFVKLLEKSETSGKLKEAPKGETISTVKVDASTSVTTATLSLPHTGPFVAYITVEDKAGNYIRARRIFLFDNSSHVDLLGGPPKVTQASTTGWINQTYKYLEVTWKGHFMNIQHTESRWLEAVEFTNEVEDDLDDRNGITLRNTTRIRHINGIVRTDIGYTVTLNDTDREVNYFQIPVNYFLEERMEIKEALYDGTRIKFNVRSFDSFEAFGQDNVTIYIDLSPPIIENVWLTQGDFVNLSVHSVTDLTKLNLEWEVYDVHSGLHEMSWRIFDNFTSNVIVHGQKYESPFGEADTLTACTTKYGRMARGANCYCTPYNGCFHKHYQVIPQTHDKYGIHPNRSDGVHESEYFLEVTALNNAMLKTIVYYKITIDDSPPHEGVVHDGIAGQPEVDFQQEFLITAHWDDFFDKESSVWFYQYAFGTSCFSSQYFDVNNTAISVTYSTTATYNAPASGKYYVTVVAYNHALDGSKPVCSDGVTVDSSPVDISDVVVKGARTPVGILRSQSGDVYYLNGDRELSQILSPTQTCIDKSMQLPDTTIAMYPKVRSVNGSLIQMSSAVCNNVGNVHTSVVSFVTSDSHLEVSWNASLGVSRLQDYEVGLGESNSGYPNKMAYMSTRHHAFTKIIYPNIWDGDEFDIYIKTTSKSGFVTEKSIGPFVVDTIPPEFSGSLTVTQERVNNRLYLKVSWPNTAFTDHADPHPLKYTVAVGTTPNSHDVVPFSSFVYGGSCTEATTPVCTLVANSNIHDHETYYVTVKATDTAGLFVLATSEVYIHKVELTSAGIVHDIDLSTQNQFADIDDIDFQTSTQKLVVRWNGFHHPYADVVFTVCIREGSTAKYMTCATKSGTESTHEFTGLTLTPYETYYHDVTASTEAGNVTARSDGVTVVVENDQLTWMTVYDGKGCDSFSISNDFNLNKLHHDEDKRQPCENDVDFQSSTNDLFAHWTVPTDKQYFVKEAYWAVEERALVVDYWTMIKEFEHLKSSENLAHSDMHLMAGRKYRILIKFCASQLCFQPVKTNGVMIVPNPPVASTFISIEETQQNQITVKFSRFTDSDIQDPDEQSLVMDHYEWAYLDSNETGKLLTKWTKVQDDGTNINLIRFTIANSAAIEFTKCWMLSVRGYTKAGLSSTVSTEVKNCSDINEVRPTIVIDAIGEIELSSQDGHDGQGVFLEENRHWTKADVDYTPYKNILSAVWPTLRHKNYTWAVLLDTNLDPTIFYETSRQLNLKDPCSHPDAIACGKTTEGYMNARFAEGELRHGRRYMVCVHAESTGIQHEFWTQQLNVTDSCSDGVTVDLTPPNTAEVWIGTNKGEHFQTTTSDMTIRWNSFTDVEEEGYSVHTSGITSYLVALGTASGGIDIVSYMNVGLVNHHTFHGLSLQNGHTYFAMVKGYDFTNQSAREVSAGVKIDSTPPAVTEKVIFIPGRHVTSLTQVYACWTGVFEDNESGISHYEWSVGTQDGYSDVMDFITTSNDCDQTPVDQPLSLTEGHAYFITVKVYNNAGLFTLHSSWAFTVDASPPVTGFVNDGPPPTTGQVQDLDYTTVPSKLGAHWTKFHDPHTAVTDYYVAVGTCAGCEDVISRRPISIKTEIILDNLKLAEGARYYTTVTACNSADLCSSKSSDGIMVDTSPPTTGHVLDGTTGKDIRYQASQIVTGCEWYGFYDPQSQISHYTWRLGTTKGGDDLLTAQNVHTATEAFVPDYKSLMGNKLPANKMIYCTVRAYNKAGLYNEATSNGFIIDSSAPTFKQPLTQAYIGAVTLGTSVLKKVLRVYWNVTDLESAIDQQYLSISSHQGGDFNVSSTKVSGVCRDHTFTGLNLHDGSYYDVKLVSCNGAGLCSNSIVRNILVDSTPPTTGVFAIHTDHAAALKRQPRGWMTWNPISIKLAWLGFEDLHSGIQYYEINVGTKFMGDDLNIVTGKPYNVPHYDKGTFYEDGTVQTYTVNTKPINYPSVKSVYVSMIAVNRVGLPSSILHAKFDLFDRGSMALVRRCSAQTCDGHCVCASQEEFCPSKHLPCTDLSYMGYDAAKTVKVVTDLRFLSSTKHTSYSPVGSMLGGQWNIPAINGITPLWYEWSVGQTNMNEPTGIFTKHTEKYWFEAGRRKHWIATLERELTSLHVEYSFFVKAWYTNTSYAVFKSPGIRYIDSAPHTNTKRGSRVKELLLGSIKDVDYVATSSRLFANWTNKFQTSEVPIWKFHLYLSTYPGGHDAHIISTDLPASTVTYELTGLHYDNYTIYYTVVQAFNHAGLHTVAYSDGFMMDADPPNTGSVFDGKVLRDVDSTSINDSLAIFWHGFSDTASGILKYEYCFSSQPDEESCNVSPWKSAGIGSSAQVKLANPVAHGSVVTGKVRAYDGAGHVSATVTSNGVIVDTTPPVRAASVGCEDSLIKVNEISDIIARMNITIDDPCIDIPVGDWGYIQGSCISTTSETTNALIVQGTLYRTINITTPGKYRVTFQTSTAARKTLQKATNEGYVSFNGVEHAFLLYTKPGTGQLSWQHNSFVFDVTKSGSFDLHIGTWLLQQAIVVTNIAVQRCAVDTQKTKERSGHVDAHVVFVHDWSSVHAEWSFLDWETSIVEYYWAIGTVPGGTQLQAFTSLGFQTFAYTNDVHLVHNTTVYVTVVAENAAGLRTVSHSDLVLIDLSPPEFLYVYDGSEQGVDIDYQKTLVISVNWYVTDPESGLQECSWCLGLFPGDSSLLTVTGVDAKAENEAATLQQNPNETIYATITCKNRAGLASSKSSDGVRVLQQPPATDDVIIEILTSSSTQYPARMNYHGNNSVVRFRWTGFNYDEGIDSLMVSLKGNGIDASEIVPGASTGFSYASFNGLAIVDGEYTVSVAAVNEVQMVTGKKSSTFRLITKPPALIGQANFGLQWNKDTSTLKCTWSGVFSSHHPLFYEVTARLTENGNGDLLQWQETTETKLLIKIDAADIPETGASVEVFVRAIGPSGLFTTANAVITI